MITIKRYILPILILLISMVYLFFIPNEPASVKITFKILPMILIIIYAFLQIRGSTTPSGTQWLIIIGLIFCMLGDGLLEGWFVIGLVAFLTGHLFYIAAFAKRWTFSVISFAAVIPIAVYAFLIGKELITSLNDTGNASLIFPVAVYIIVISLMLWFAIMSKNKWAIIGSTLFVTSDSILAWNMFVSSIEQSSFLIMTTYYSAQFLIAHSVGTFKSKSNDAI